MTEKKIVIVDDDDCIRKTFFMILHGNYRVYLAKDPREALNKFIKADIDLIIADLKLPYLNGVEMISQFRDAGYKGDVILISAFPDLVSADELKRLSIARFFVKPLDLNALDRSIEHLLNEKSPGLQDLKERTLCRVE
ncbi:MAG: response regulator [Candidatus Aminicenantes bacterium]|nr:response regulator [Candidatus Aminicenantes bacterium]